ncbi:hypothetical protein H8356DRAFT_1326833 [Neocallimastix lanati (nom. inval.)]|nr:hypothetical protein H8356DRAFT_1326833 [Neocallimastix sp. JGI-2020a]
MKIYLRKPNLKKLKFIGNLIMDIVIRKTVSENCPTTCSLGGTGVQKQSIEILKKKRPLQRKTATAWPIRSMIPAVLVTARYELYRPSFLEPLAPNLYLLAFAGAFAAFMLRAAASSPMSWPNQEGYRYCKRKHKNRLQ